MKHNIKPNSMLGFFTIALLTLTLINGSFAQVIKSNKDKEQLKQWYNTINKPEISFDKFLELSTQTLSTTTRQISNATQANTLASAKINDCSSLHTVCGNGDFEKDEIDATEWRGGYGTFGGGQPSPFALTQGFIAGDITDFNAHQTIVGVGADPNVPIQRVAADGGNHALRIGNAVNNFGTEFISKTFMVTADKTIFPFRYALVFQDPGHAPENQPAFSVKAYDCNGAELPNICDLGNGSNIAVSKASNPFFTSFAGGSIAYKDWSQAQINLSAYIGQIVTIVFLNKDCGLGGHWGYTYLDNLCTVCTTGCPYNISVNPATTSTCGVGNICLDYSIPKIGVKTGNLIIDLDIYQNGIKVGSTQSSPLLTSNNSYCFSIDPGTLGLDGNATGFDYIVTGRFSINGFPLSPVIVGQPPAGQTAGQNNDYMFSKTNAVCKPATVTLINGTATITAKDVDGGSVATCGFKSITVSKTSFNCSNIGANNVDLTVTDVNGVVSTCTAVVTVVGDIPSCSLTAVPTSNVYTGGVPTNIYLGYGPQSVKLSSTAPAGVTYSWSPTTGLSDPASGAPIFTPTAAGNYTCTVTVTNKNGCTASASINICVLDIKVPGTDGKKVYVCHYPPGNPANMQTLSISINAVDAHIFYPGHGDHLGTCDQQPCTQPAIAAISVSPLQSIINNPASSVSKIAVVPNPSNGQFTLQLNNLKGTSAFVTLLNANGAIIERKTVRINTRGNSLSFNLKSKMAGQYFIKIISDEGIRTEKIIIQQ